MPKKEFVMRGQTVSGAQERLNFGGHKSGYAYRLVQFQLYPSTNLSSNISYEMCASITAHGRVGVDPQNPDFNDEGLIATGYIQDHDSVAYPHSETYVINDLFLITQDLILWVFDEQGNPVNWQCRFVSEKMSGPEAAVANYKQFTISD
tara:strand:- start:12 stop:458 length:447 start_codon:yes stop_codon:yes gene_type:complete